MALINDLYVFVEDEDVGREIDATEHPVEKGINITDHVNPKAITVSLKGRIVGSNAANTIQLLQKMMQTGVLVKYIGRSTMSNAIITKFNTSHPNTIHGGCSFTCEIKKVRIAQSAYKAAESTKTSTKTAAKSKTGTQQKTTKSTATAVYHTVKKGDTVWALVAASKGPYKSLGMSCDDVMKNNPDAFSRKGDFRTLKIGAKLLVGYRK